VPAAVLEAFEEDITVDLPRVEGSQVDLAPQLVTSAEDPTTLLEIAKHRP